MEKYITKYEVGSKLSNNIRFIYSTVENHPEYKVVSSTFIPLLDSNLTIIVLKKKSLLDKLFNL